jgi:hemolysin activation/secretion protein
MKTIGGRLLAAMLLAWPGFARPQAAEEPPPPPRFEIRQFVVEGNTLLPQADVDRLVGPFTGANRDFGDVQQALEALQDEFIDRGYSAVRVLIPEQDIRVGQVRLQVIEARLGNIRIEGNRFFDEANVRASLPALQPGFSPNAHEISRNIQLANENPSRQVAVSLESADEDGKVDALVRVTDDDPARTTVFIDNSGTKATGYFRSGIGYQNANAFNRDHVVNAQAITSPTQWDDVAIIGAGYRVPIYGWGGTFETFAGHSDVNSGTVQNLFTVSGAGTIFGMRYTQTLPRIETYEHKLALGYDYRSFQQNVTLVGATGTLIPEVQVQPWSLTYSGRVSQVGRDFSFFGTYSSNMPGGTDGSQDAVSRQRAGARAGYEIWRYGAALSQVLPDDYMVRAVVNGQYTRDMMITGEQFGMGGADSVRGFLERETANDVGHRFTIEGYAPDFGARIGENWRARVLAFTDTARGYDRLPTRGPVNGLGSVGLGLRATQGKVLSIRTDWAYVTNGAGTRPAGTNRFTFSLAYSF